jgi:hypothetical protein
MKTAAILLAATILGVACSATASPIILGLSDDGCFLVAKASPDSLLVSSNTGLGGSNYTLGLMSQALAGPLAGTALPLAANSQTLSLELAGSHLDGLVQWATLDKSGKLDGVFDWSTGTGAISLNLFFEGDPSQSIAGLLAGRTGAPALMLVSWGEVTPQSQAAPEPSTFALLVGSLLASAAMYRFNRKGNR